MKGLILSILLGFSFLAVAKKVKDLKGFNKAVGENIQDVIHQNPQMYETKPIGRKPASLGKSHQEVKNSEKLDEVDEQADTHLSW